MSTISQLQEIIAANRAAQKQARELNTRAGKNVFPILSQAEWAEKLKDLLAGARCALEIPDISALALPPLEEAKVTEILAANPDVIKVVGVEFQVAYTSGSNPVISLKKEQVELVKALPDEGITLPGGRQVEARFIYDSYWSSSYYADTNVPALKNKVAAWMNRAVWDNWGKPTLQLPNLETEMFPQILEAVYGTCQLTGKPLTGYGTVVACSSWGNVSFQAQWFQDKAAAEKANAEAKTHFEGLLVKAREDKARKTLWESVSLLQETLRQECGPLSYGDDLYQKACSLRYVSDSSSLEELNNYKAEAEKLLEEIKAELVRREAAERLAEEANKWAEEVQAFASEQDPAEAYVLATEDGRLYVNCGKASKMGKVTVEPALGERVPLIYSPNTDPKICMWREFPAGKKVHFVDYAGSGSVNTEITFYLETGQLSSGIWAVTYDDAGNYFYPIIYYREGTRVLPDTIVTVDEREAPVEEVKAAGMSDLLKKFGDPHAGKKK